jgi:hypothetical protein
MDRASFLKSLLVLTAVPKVAQSALTVASSVPPAAVATAKITEKTLMSAFVPDMWTRRIEQQLMMNSYMKSIVDEAYRQSAITDVMKGRA